jgi:two-component system nitrogen regulation response regulator GlnG
MTTATIWIVDDDSSIRWVLDKALKSQHFNTLAFSDAQTLLTKLEFEQPDIIISDIRMPEITGLELMGKVHKIHPDLPIIIMTAHSDLDSAVNAYQAGAFEYLPKPFDIDEAVSLATRAVTHAKEQSKNRRKNKNVSPVTEIIGEAPAMQEVFRAIGRLSRSSISVLINGESGTGKELVAHALHKHSPRVNNEFIALNMAAIPKDLIESELFGHEKGAFTGASGVRSGRFEQANGGTLFLDEIGDMPIDIQTRLLRVLSDGQFYRVGGHSPVSVDVRIIAATHQNLEKRVADGSFREDLFHRLNVIRIHIPSLNERREDIPKLANHFLIRAGKELGVETKILSKEAQTFLANHHWSGNVRQLENICRWLTVMASGQEIFIADLPHEITNDVPGQDSQNEIMHGTDWRNQLKTWTAQQLASGRSDILAEAMPDFERIMLQTALEYTRGHKQDAAKLLGWGRNTLTRKLKELDIH